MAGNMPWKIKTEPKTHLIEKEYHLPNLYVWVPCYFSRVYQYVQAKHIFLRMGLFFEPAMLVDTGMLFLRIHQLQGCLFCLDNTIGTVIKI